MQNYLAMSKKAVILHAFLSRAYRSRKIAFEIFRGLGSSK